MKRVGINFIVFKIMKTQMKLILSCLVLIFSVLYACNSDNDTAPEDTSNSQTEVFNDSSQRRMLVNEIDYHPDLPCPLSGPSCVRQGGSTTFTISCTSNPSGNVYWSYQSGVGITPTTALGLNGLGTSSQAFTFSSNFQQGWIQAVCDGSFGCKDNIIALPCSTAPSCSISGPNCGVVGDTLTYTFNGASNVNWSSASPGITLVSSSGNTATFSLNSNFGTNGGTITGSAPGCGTIIFGIDNCCESSGITIDKNGRIYKN